MSDRKRKHSTKPSLATKYALVEATGVQLPRLRALVETRTIGVVSPKWVDRWTPGYLTHVGEEAKRHWRVTLEMRLNKGVWKQGDRKKGIRAQGTRHYVSYGEAKGSLKAATEEAAIHMDEALGEGWYAAELYALLVAATVFLRKHRPLFDLRRGIAASPFNVRDRADEFSVGWHQGL